MSRPPRGVRVGVPRNRDAPICTATFYPGFLTCDLRLIGHKMHHDPTGVWWCLCTLPDHRNHPARITHDEEHPEA